MATTTTTTLDESYALLNTGACLVENKGPQSVLIHIGSVAPADDTGAHHTLMPGRNMSYPGSDKVYARAYQDSAKVVTTGVV
jgi:hypothetical protein